MKGFDWFIMPSSAFKHYSYQEYLAIHHYHLNFNQIVVEDFNFINCLLLRNYCWSALVEFKGLTIVVVHVK